jgi:hypothetical protein
MAVSFTLTPQDVASARMRAAGVFPKSEIFGTLGAFTLVIALSLTRFELPMTGLITGGIGAFAAARLIAVSRIQDGALAAFRANSQLRARTDASWDDRGVTVQPSGFGAVTVPWSDVIRILENERLVLLVQRTGIFHAIPKRAFSDAAALREFCAYVRGQTKTT